MKISLIIPTRNGGPFLRELFLTLQEQSVKPEQILVVDSSSSDDTLTVCRDFDIDFVQMGSRGFDHGGTRNLAASFAKGEILVFMTQDAFFKDAEGLRNLIRPLEDPLIAASFGKQVPKKDANPIEIFARQFNYPSVELVKRFEDLPKLGVKTFFFSNACSAIKRSAYEEVGGFPEKTIMNEDMFLAAKFIVKGYRIAYQPDAVVYHSHNYSLGIQFKRYFDIGVFFCRNRWIRDLSNSEREGIKYVKEALRFLSFNEKKKWIPYALADVAVRFLGYRMGLSERYLPISIKKRVSLNKGFWEGEISSPEGKVF
jgi:rhamnosyltransferase